MSAQPAVVAAYDKALGAVGDRYDGLEDAVHALADLVTQHPALGAAVLDLTPEAPHPLGSRTTLGDDVVQLVELIEQLGIGISRLELFPPIGDPSPPTAPEEDAR